ncbi:MAG: hypothetical protein A3F89_02815 [Deltaproteobacteria bacterium RIFCSPLOWO2_12_FULL_50_11]|nr:MAG: hypothetical protein A3F89_02815 [Deltaproteobacteria bacterium RIFCSPLOWO2_12_FULL_50_11]
MASVLHLYPGKMLWRYFFTPVFVILFLSGTVYADWVTSSLRLTAAHEGQCSRVVLDHNGRIHVTYMHDEGGRRRIQYVRKTSTDPAWSTPVSVSVEGQSVGCNHSLNVTPSQIGVSYAIAGDENHLLQAKRDLWPEDPGAPWTYQTMDAVGGVGAYPSVVIDDKGGHHAIYWDETNKGLKYAHRAADSAEWSFDEAPYIIRNGPVSAREGESMEYRIHPLNIAHYVTMSSSGTPLVLLKNTVVNTREGDAVLAEGILLANKRVYGDNAWETTPLMATPDFFPAEVAGSRFGDQFDMTTVPARPITGFHGCYYDREAGSLKYFRFGGGGMDPKIKVVATTGNTFEVKDECAIALCGNQVHVLSRQNRDAAEDDLDRHFYLSFSRPYNAAPDVEWVLRLVAQERGVVDDRGGRWYPSMTCDALGGVHLTVPLMRTGDMDLFYGYLSPSEALGPPSCGDLICSGEENMETCLGDCARCGDGVCTTSQEGGENCFTCAADCGACPMCGDRPLFPGEECREKKEFDLDKFLKLLLSPLGGEGGGMQINLEMDKKDPSPKDNQQAPASGANDSNAQETPKTGGCALVP